MKRAILLSLILLLSISTIFADINSGFAGSTFGYSTVNGKPSIGTNVSYQYLVPIDGNIYFGINTIASCNWIISSPSEMGIGLTSGPAFGFAITPANFTALSFGPGIYTESKGNDDYLGVGIGLDLNHTFFLGETKSLGITIGATGYLMMASIDDSGTTSDLQLSAAAYMGFTFRAGNYSSNISTYYNIY